MRSVLFLLFLLFLWNPLLFSLIGEERRVIVFSSFQVQEVNDAISPTESSYQELRRELEKQKIIIYFLFSALVIAVFLLALMFRRQKKASLAFRLLSEKNNEISMQREKLEDLNLTKNKLLSIISHDLKSPLNSLRGFLFVLFHSLEKYNDKELLEMGRKISMSVDMITVLLDNLLTWANAQSGTIKFNAVEIDLNKLGEEVCFLFIPIAQGKKIKLVNKLREFSHTVKGDPDLLKTILRNLISNALKFTNEGGQVVLDAEIQKSKAVVMVADNGVGIYDEMKSSLFKVEEKISTKGTRQEPGTGLGLLLCKEFVELHGGQIWFESELKKGTTFYFTVPLMK